MTGMNIKDTLALRGDFELQIFRAGELIERYRDPNMIMDATRDALARLLAGDGAGKSVSQIGFGTDGNGPSPDDAALTAGYVKAIAAHSYPVAGQVRFDWTLSTAEANGKTIREFGLLAADGTLIARKTRGAIEKGDDISLAGSWTIIF